MTEFGPFEGELLALPGQRTGVIIALQGAVTTADAAHIRDELERRFPGVTFAVIDQCTAILSFTFDAEDPS